jgi:hypothetical protein
MYNKNYVPGHKRFLNKFYSGNISLNECPDICELNEKQQILPLYEKFSTYFI